MNLCHPDLSKSCAACCGLYNVADGRREVLSTSIMVRTRMFRKVPRTVAAMEDYAQSVRNWSEMSSIDNEIHVCEYTGFMDTLCLTVGCMLHPGAPGNNGIDFRGVGYYGSVACKTFYCQAFEELNDCSYQIVRNLIKDWHLYGLVVTDTNYVSTLLEIIELLLGKKPDPAISMKPTPAMKLLKVLEWKRSWLCGMDSKKRRSGYYLKREPVAKDEGALLDSIVDSLCYTFDISGISRECFPLVRRGIRDFVRTYQLAEVTTH